MWSYTIRYAQATTGMGERAAADWVIAALVAFMVGRFIGTALMSRFNPARLMAAYAAINIALALVAFLAPGLVGLVALTALSFFMSIMFPTIFALGVKDLGPYTQTGSSLIVMAIVGGAVLTPVMGADVDLWLDPALDAGAGGLLRGDRALCVVERSPGGEVGSARSAGRMIDAHQHVWQLGRNGCVWPTEAEAPIFRDYGLADFRAEAAPCGVARTVLVQSQEDARDTDWLLDLAEGDGWWRA